MKFNTVLFVNATIGFSENLFLVFFSCFHVCVIRIGLRDVSVVRETEWLLERFFHALRTLRTANCTLFIVAFLENATIGYSLESLCVCVFVCVFLHDNSKRNRSRNTKSEYIVVYENSSDEFDIELHRIKVKVTVGVQKFSPFTTIQTVRSCSSTLVQARNLILSIYLHLILIYKIYECRHA